MYFIISALCFIGFIIAIMFSAQIPGESDSANKEKKSKRIIGISVSTVVLLTFCGVFFALGLRNRRPGKSILSF